MAVTTKHICCQTRRPTASDNIGWSKDISIWTNTAKLSRSDWHRLVIEFNCRSIHPECQATLTKLLSGIFDFQNGISQHWPTRYWAEPLLFVQKYYNLTNIYNFKLYLLLSTSMSTFRMFDLNVTENKFICNQNKSLEVGLHILHYWDRCVAQRLRARSTFMWLQIQIFRQGPIKSCLGNRTWLSTSVYEILINDNFLGIFSLR